MGRVITFAMHDGTDIADVAIPDSLDTATLLALVVHYMRHQLGKRYVAAGIHHHGRGTIYASGGRLPLTLSETTTPHLVVGTFTVEGTHTHPTVTRLD